MLASLRPADGVQLWEVATGQERLGVTGLPRDVRAIALAPGGRLLAWGTAAGTVGLWDPLTRERLWQCRGHRGSVDHLAFSADGTRLLSGSADTTALLWDVPRLRSPRQAEK
jgi:WD40 repeat protein